MILTNKQEEGLKIAVARYKAHESYTIISGYAGSGKSTLIRFIIDALGISEEFICFAAYTGKASQVLKEKGNPNPMTLHKLLYKPIPKRDGGFIFKPKEDLEGLLLVVVDEVSMVPGSMWNLLLSYGVHVIALGDPSQLPPVDKKDTQDVLAHPHIFLDEIIRQAYDSEIIRLSMWIREGKSLSDYQGSNQEVMIVDRLNEGMLTWADQILCATNKTRTSLNKQYRNLLGFGAQPQIGDKIISLRNQWDFGSLSIDPAPLTNGSIGVITECNRDYFSFPREIVPEGSVPILWTNMTDECGENFMSIPIDYCSLFKGKKFLRDDQEGRIRLSKKKDMDPLPFEFAYAYAITVWKYQGSQNNKILLFEEDFPFDEETHKRYLYTGITRAVDKIVIVRK